MDDGRSWSLIYAHGVGGTAVYGVKDKTNVCSWMPIVQGLEDRQCEAFLAGASHLFRGFVFQVLEWHRRVAVCTYYDDTAGFQWHKAPCFHGRCPGKSPVLNRPAHWCDASTVIVLDRLTPEQRDVGGCRRATSWKAA